MLGELDYGFLAFIQQMIADKQRLAEMQSQFPPGKISPVGSCDQRGNNGDVLESLVDEINQLRIANGLVEVSGPGIEILIVGPVSVLDLHDLINEIRNAGAEALSLNGQRIVTWSAISYDGDSVTVDGEAVQGPYRLRAIGDGDAMEAALVRPGGILHILVQSREDISTEVQQKEKITLPVCRQAMEFGYATPLE